MWGQRHALFLSLAIGPFGMYERHLFFMLYFVNFVVSRHFQYKID